MVNIKFGTDGWRAVIGKEYTTDNVARISLGVTEWLKNKSNPSVVVGHDCRFGGEMFTETVAKVLSINGVKVHLAKGVVSTPMVSLGTVLEKADLGIVITASHNPPSYNGYKLKGSYGGALLPEGVDAIEKLIPDENTVDIDNISIDEQIKKGMIFIIDLEQMYFDRVEERFDMDAIRNSTKFHFAYDAMYGAGQIIAHRLLPNLTSLHCEMNPGFNDTPPEPILRNLGEFSEFIKSKNGAISSGLVTDGDADRIGLLDSHGNFVDSHHVIALLIKYMVEEKGQKGKVVLGFSTSPKVLRLCEHFGLEYEIVKIGFKHIAGKMLEEGTFLGGEESGGIALKSHLPERDGIWMGMVIWEYMVKTGKSLEELIKEIHDIVGDFSYSRDDLHISEAQKQQVMKNLAEGTYKEFGGYKVNETKTIDGYKYFLDGDQWLMIRPSGTEPVLRMYAGGPNMEMVQNLLKKTQQQLLK